MESGIRRPSRVVVENRALESRESGCASAWQWGSNLNLRKIGWHSGLGTDDLNPRVPDLVCSESRRSVFTGLELGLGRGRKWLGFLTWFLDFNSISLGFLASLFSRLTKLPYLSQNAFFCLKIWAIFIESLMKHGATWSSSTLLHAASCCVSFSGCLLRKFCPISTSFWPFNHPFLDRRLRVFHLDLVKTGVYGNPVLSTF